MNTWERIKAFLRRLIDWFLKGTHDHFACYLPESIGILASRLLRFFYAAIAVDEESTKVLAELKKKGILVYATKYKSTFEYLLLYARLPRHGAPPPRVSFDQSILWWQPVSRVCRIAVAWLDSMCRFRKRPDPYESGFYKRMLTEGCAGLVPMVDAKAFHRRYVHAGHDPLAFLISMAKESDRPVYLAPQTVLYGKKPRKSRFRVRESVFGTEEKPNLFGRFMSLFKLPSQALVEASEPIHLQVFLDRPENRGRTTEFLSHALRQEVIESINRHMQSIVGPVLRTRQELKESVLKSDDFRKFLADYARDEDKPVQEFHKEADAYLEEIAAKYSNKMIAFLELFIRWISNNMFDGVDVDQKGLRKLRETSRKGPLVLVPCHKSHIDYLILSYILYHNNMPCPLIAAGKNLSFFPVGSIFRRGGAFFIRRTFKGQELYARVFSEYIKAVLRERFNVEFFIEGGRSRTGKLVLPKFGLLSMLLNAYLEDACKELYFVPVYIGYDRVVEEASYVHELEGGEKESENLGQVVGASRFLKRRFGRIFVRFNDPIRLEDVLNSFPVPGKKMTQEERQVVVRNLGHRIIGAIDEVTVVTPHSLAAAAILTAFDRSFSFGELMEWVDFFIIHLKANKAELSDTLMDPEPAVEKALKAYMSDKFLIREGRGLEEEEIDPKARYSIVSTKRPLLDYYKNNCIAFFIPEAFTALAILDLDAFQFSTSNLYDRYAFLQDFFKNEFHYDPDQTPEQYVRRCLKTFIDAAMIVPHPTLPDTFNVTSGGFKKMAVLANFLKPYFECYKVILQLFTDQDAKELDKKERYKKFRQTGAKMLKKEEITRPESLNKVTADNAAAYFMDRGIQTREDVEELEWYGDVIDNFLKHIRM